MANKALVIDVQERSKLNGALEQWQTIGNMQAFTRDIETPSVEENADKSAIVSGIPTVYARANMFSMALSYTGDSMANVSAGMNQYYDELVDEWFGLIACIALDSGKLQIKRVELGYSDNGTLGTTNNLYEAKGAFGNMLFERKPLWTEQTQEKGERNPFINIIKYNNQVVGGTSPECLLFTSPSYSITPDPRYAPQGKFRDPVKYGNVSEKDWLALYAYVKNLIEKLNREFTIYFQNLDDSLKPSFGGISSRLALWLDEIRNQIDDVEKATANPVAGFTSPFSLIFNYSDDMYGINGAISNNPHEGYTRFKAEELLLPRGSEIARIILTPQAVKNYSQLPVQLLEASIKGSESNEKAYFAIPLSSVGMKIFGSSISALIGQQYSQEIRSSMTAEFDPSRKDNNLTVYLTINSLEGSTRNIVAVYTAKSDRVVQNSDILIWPNFISKQWNKYFMYSEMPHAANSISFNAIPFVGELTDGKFLPLCGEDNNPLYLTGDKEILKGKGIDSTLLVTSDHRVAESSYKYEIYQSNKPFSGVKLISGYDREGKEKASGFLIIRYDTGNVSGLPKNKMGITATLATKVRLGFDFGSTNSSVAYYVLNDDLNDDTHTKGSGLTFKNRRISLFGADEGLGRYQPKDFFFFSKRETPSNALKSILTLHDSSRLPNDTGVRQMAVSGGMPCFLSNLPIESVDSNHIRLNFGKDITATLINNMKWSTSTEEKDYKTAYLRTVLLMVYAELFEQNMRPTELNWSYPSTMEQSMVSTQYAQIWGNLDKGMVSPILDAENDQVIDLGVKKKNIESQKNGLSDNGDNGQGNLLSGLGIDTSESLLSNMGVENENHGGLYDNLANDGLVSKGGLYEGDDPEPKKEERELDLNPGSWQQSIDFNRINTDNPMTEACASANFKAQTANIQQKLVYCFDVGGSTTDISVLFALKRDVDTNARRIVIPHMIKQSSILFAAQRVAGVTRELHEEFRRVLNSVCERFEIKLIGFNVGDSRYDATTAPYYYEQMVDILDAEQLKFFYGKIAEFCPRLFAVNMYVTGLIIFYAGQLSGPLYEATMRNKDRDLPTPNGFELTFAGKGARVFEWLNTINPSQADAYYKLMFKLGAGPNENGKYLKDEAITISLIGDEESNKNVKYEVSKGLASKNGNLQEPSKSFEIFAENGFKGFSKSGQTYNYNFTTKLTAEWMGEIGGCIRQDKPNCECFAQFLDKYYMSVRQILGLGVSKDECLKGLKSMNIEQYIVQELPRFKEALQRARGGDKFDYVAPIIIVEGMKFYEKHLLKCFRS